MATLIVSATPAIASADVPFVKIEEVTPVGNGLDRVFFGHVVARETVDLAFQVGGQIVELPVEEGAVVPEGDLVARLDQESFELSLAEAEAQAAQSQRILERYQKLVGGAISRTELQDAETQVELARIKVRNARRSLEKATLSAPFDALVASRLVPNYSTINSGTPVVRLHDMSELRIEIDVPETIFQRAGNDANLEVFAEFPATDESFPLEVREFNAETTAVSQTYSITLGMEPPEGLKILPGSSAKVTARLRTNGTHLEIPASAIVLDSDGNPGVMVFKAEEGDRGTVKRTPIEIKATESGRVEVISGLEAGQEIVAVGASSLSDGDAVRRFVGFEG
ncbi:efflux RND transporter periplasmic adaptor subunit [Nitratireductor basaltis]|nr:efflux RND transporter periplasmic adaptor subunit [Nitratireductor basaltis]